MDDLLKTLADSGVKTEKKDDFTFFTCADGNLAIYCPKPRKCFYFKIPDSFADPMDLLQNINFQGMNKVLYLDSRKAQEYSRFVFKSALLKRKNLNQPKDFNPRDELKKIIAAFLEDMVLTVSEWENLINFVQSFQIEQPGEFLLSGLFEGFISLAEARFSMFRTESVKKRYQLVSEITGKPFCIMCGNGAGSIFIHLPGTPPAADLKPVSAQKDWYVLRPVIHYNDISRLFGFIKEALGRASHGKFWPK
ncbi:MAG: hypothetical protein PHW04_07445 [Candidatus Wallbacteria bacterium]|nr:hypothetical protein [Candidatus Wallbacteria bacterium]